MNHHWSLRKRSGRRLLAFTAILTFGMVLGAGPALACPPDQATLTLKKIVVNTTAGGSAVAGNWTLSAEGPTSFSGARSVSKDVNPGSYTLSESDGPDHYVASGWVCTGVANSGATVTLAAGQSATCTITNTFNPPQAHTADLTLVKHVEGEGGTALATAWTLDASGGPTPFGAGPTGVHQKVADGTYTLSESGTPANYSPSLWDCTNTEVNRTTVVIGPNDSAVTCTITNTFVPPPPTTATLKLVKVVANTLGGSAAASAWTLTATGLTSFSGLGSASPSSAVLPGVYALSESVGPTGYSPSAWVCSPVVSIGAQVTLTAGQIETCTITNTFVPTVVTPAVPAVEEVTTAPPDTAPVKVVEGAVVTEAAVVAPASVTELAFTGAETVQLGLSGLLALLLGVGLVAAARRQGRRAIN